MENKKVSERDERINKLEELKKKGINPYPAKVNRSHSVNEALLDFDGLQKNETAIDLVGRLRSVREHGNLTFAHLQDGTGMIQIAISKKEIGADNYKDFLKLIDTGDFIEIKGVCFVTHKGEKSVMAKEWKIISKALRPLPDKWHGLQDEEEKFRKRYLDILFNPEVREMFEKKAKFWRAIRDFMLEKGFMEVETPALENTTGGADARPFITHHNALNIDVYFHG